MKSLYRQVAAYEDLDVSELARFLRAAESAATQANKSFLGKAKYNQKVLETLKGKVDDLAKEALAAQKELDRLLKSTKKAPPVYKLNK